MCDYCEFKLYFEFPKDFSTFYFSFDENTTFEQLLEFVLYIFPQKNLCNCFKFQYKHDKSNKANPLYDDIDMNLKVKEFVSEKNYKFKPIHIYIVKNNSYKECTCNSLIKDYYKKSKKELIKCFKKKLENCLNDAKNEITDNQNKIKSLEEEKKELQKKLNHLEKENNSKIIAYEKENKNLKNEINELNLSKLKNEDSISKRYKEEINKLNKEKQLLEIAINGDINKINQLKNLGVTGEFLKPKNNILQVDPETNKIISNEKLNKDNNFMDFYDVIVDIKSLKDINDGWKVKMSQRAKENYENFKNEKIIKIGVIGNSNKGKSFILSKISKIDLPSGTSIRTEGLSIKYPELDLYKNRLIALMDSAGLETPVLKEQNNLIITKEKNENNIEKEGENQKEEKDTDNKGEDEKELFREKSREKLITELFLQNYIINNSNILLIVVSILTYSEQKLLNRIRTEIKKAKLNKHLFILHNLMTYTSIEQVEEYIDNILLKSATFNLEKGHNISTKLEEKSGIYFYEKETEPKIYHLIYANEGSEAGNLYNNFTLDFIENQYANVTDLKPFDVIETIKDKFVDISKEIIEKLENPLTKNDFDNSNNETIKLKNIKNIKLKKCLIDELGFSNLKTNGFNPVYNYYKKDDKIIIRVEAPGNSSIKVKKEHAGEYTITVKVLL